MIKAFWPRMVEFCFVTLPLATGLAAMAGCGKNSPLGLGYTTEHGMRSITSGTFQMGSPDTTFTEAIPRHSVTVSAFLIDTTEVTQMEYQNIMGANPSYFTGDLKLPVESVTWFDAVLFCNAKSRKDGYDTVYFFSAISGTPGKGCTDLRGIAINYAMNGYRLPTEAEFEFACRAGTTSGFYWGIQNHDLYAWDFGNSDSKTHEVAEKLPNAWGLFDMAGNVWEWCNDWYADYTAESQSDPTGPANGVNRTIRGGSWDLYNSGLLSASRFYYPPGFGYADHGFRCVRRTKN